MSTPRQPVELIDEVFELKQDSSAILMFQVLRNRFNRSGPEYRRYWWIMEITSIGMSIRERGIPYDNIMFNVNDDGQVREINEPI